MQRPRLSLVRQNLAACLFSSTLLARSITTLALGMTDPFSVAGSAVGVVSLGITACKGLIWYIDNAKDAEDRASQISDRLDSLASHLELLQTIVEKFGPSQCVSATTSAITACATAIEEIRKRLGKLGKPKGSSGIRHETPPLVSLQTRRHFVLERYFERYPSGLTYRSFDFEFVCGLLCVHGHAKLIEDLGNSIIEMWRISDSKLPRLRGSTNLEVKLSSTDNKYSMMRPVCG